MRIVIGVNEVANIVSTYAKGFRALGHEPITVVGSKSVFYPDSVYDVVLNDFSNNNRLQRMFKTLRGKIQLAELVPKLIDESDVFIFAWGTSFLPGFLDYKFIKEAGKKIVTTFWGSDIRYWRAYLQEMEVLGVEDEIHPFVEYIRNTPDYKSRYYDKKRIVYAAEKYADLILSQPGYGQLQTRPYMRANVPLDLSLYRYKDSNREIPLVLHAPSRRGVKGTDIVLETVNRLQNEGVRFEFRLVENTPNSEVRNLLSETDIVVDELYSETIGVLSTEAMASGAVTLVRYMPEYARTPEGCPAVNVNRDNLYQKLREVILDRDLRKGIIEAGRPYVEIHNDHIKVAENILKWLDGTKQNEIVPAFTYRSNVLSELFS